MCKILLMEDEYLEREALKKIINSGLEVKKEIIEAKNIDELYKLDKVYNPDIIIVDLKDSNKPWIEAFIEQMQEKNVMLISTYNKGNSLKEINCKKISEYFLKPVRKEVLIETLNKYLEKREENYLSGELKEAIEYIEDNFQKDIALNDVAAYVNLTASYVSRLFKKKLGVNFNRYLAERKIKEAKKMLMEEENNINEIAFLVGYNEPNYFCKVFKKLEGVTPSAYRDKVLENSFA